MNQVLSSSPSPDLVEYSTVLLRLYEAARYNTVHAFQREAMILISEMLPFDRGWWGRSTVHGQVHRVHCSYLHDLPEDVPQRLNLSDPDNLVAVRTTQSPDRALYFGPQDWDQQPSTAALAAHMGIEQALCIARFDGPAGHVSFISIARRTSTPAFTTRESQLLELLMPHLSAALDLCCVAQMASLRHGGRQAMLTTDASGWVHVAESGVGELLRSEWSGWSGPQLPAPLVEQIAANRTIFLGRHLHAQTLWSGEHVLVTLRPRESRDLLTRQECAVAEAFSSGRSYKEVARELMMAPATVRHHLRAVYLKLGVTDKAMLARSMGASSSAG
ncbi:LuxR C-terminal-related transcriptional regulator [Sphaerotilus sp.]|uniref:helix-turn-helix transcriptional regulator n=1 Tax=Sphaerotilus sp. TaxID=2093942 RepID=UPI00286EA243|nr:LuxR C-terminal-related transcriptional regulator [Sphaerotilus sp.]